MAVTMIPARGAGQRGSAGQLGVRPRVDERPAFLSPSGIFAVRRLTVGIVLGLLLVIVGFAARPHLVAPDVRPASFVGSNQINPDTDGAATQLLRVNDVTGDAGQLAASASAVAATATSTYTVQAGDSLWSIAAARVSAARLDAYLARLEALNGSGVLHPGQQLILPN